ncbi:hypothetical protein [Parasitella parasitica]|uniref:BTB domain-containing protein n=1 Tax=Parasitella parasitica TaxID=35722 RepID=A0A0B7NFC8_9FUNG|nr:hypothetical protein [Parasitella parasitica]
MSFLKFGQPIQTTGNNLVGLWRPSFVKVDHRLFVYGGGGNVTNDLHVLNLFDMKWETIQTVKGFAPCGCNEFQEYCNDVHVFDVEKLAWFQPELNGSVAARYLHSASVYDDKLFIYGGFAKNSDRTYVLDELSVLDLKTFTWSKYHGVPPRYNHSATLVGHKMYIYAGKDEHGNTISDLFVVNLNTPPYTPHLVLNGSTNSQMVLLKSQHFCEAVCGKLLVFGRYLTHPNNSSSSNSAVSGSGNSGNAVAAPESMYGLWMLDLDTLTWERQDCNANFEVGGWNYFTIVSESNDQQSIDQQVTLNNLFFLGNTDPFRPQGYDHFRDALVINGETLGLYDIPPLSISCEFSRLLNNPELSDFVIVPSNGQELHVHQVILITRWPHFRNIYESGMMESRQRRMEIPEPYEVVLAFLKYLYNDRIDESESCDIVCQVLALANMYLLNRLKKICCERLYRQHLTIETCGLIFEKAITAEEVGLKLLTLDFMFKNLGYVLKSNTLLQMSPMVRMEFLEAVPEDAVLEVHRRSTRNSTHSTSTKFAASKNIPYYTTTTTTTTTTTNANLYNATTNANNNINNYNAENSIIRLTTPQHHHLLHHQQQQPQSGTSGNNDLITVTSNNNTSATTVGV